MHEVRMVHVRERAKLLLEAIEERRAEAAKCLDGDQALRLAVEGLVDHAHAALADSPADLVASGSPPAFEVDGVGRLVRHGFRGGDRSPRPPTTREGTTARNRPNRRSTSRRLLSRADGRSS